MSPAMTSQVIALVSLSKALMDAPLPESQPYLYQTGPKQGDVTALHDVAFRLVYSQAQHQIPQGS